MRSDWNRVLAPTQKAHALLDLRYAQRARVDHLITYTSDGKRYEGRLRDISKTGCLLYSPEPPLVGNLVTLSLALPDDLPPICLVGSTVSWVKGHHFGVKFRPLAADERRRVQQLVLKRVSYSPVRRERAEFRLK